MIYGNSLQAWGGALAAAGLALAFLLFLRKVLEVRLERLAKQDERIGLADLLATWAKHTRTWVLGIYALFVGSRFLAVPADAAKPFGQILYLTLLFQLATWAAQAVVLWVERFERRNLDRDAGAVTKIRALGLLLRILIWLVAILFGLHHLGVNVTAWMAGLGAGGVALAFALNRVLQDLFGSLSIVLDRPFVVGDFVDIDGLQGTIQHVGMRTTRIQSLTGEMIVIGNTDILASRIRNYRHLQERRVVLAFGVLYQTTPAQLRAIPGMVQEVIESQDKVRFDRSHFKRYGDSALEFEAVYYVVDPDYKTFMDIQQAVGFALFERFQAEGVEFAYPTRTVHLISST